jgi:serine protease Do
MSGDAVETLRRSTVQIESGGSGSGLIVESQVVTNAHVVRGVERVQVTTWDGRRLAGRVTKRHPRRDLALVSIEAGELGAAAARFAESSTVRPGAFVMAIGNPLGFIGALSTGVVQAVGAFRRLGDQPWVQASVRLAPGNSGGPLADASGCVVGINTMVVSGGLGLAIPSDVVTRFLAGKAYRLGVTLQPVVGGMRILRVDPASAAARASLREGDVLLGSMNRLSDSLERSEGLLSLQFLRGGSQNVRTVAVEVAA